MIISESSCPRSPRYDENLDGNAVLQPNALIRAVSKRENVLGLNFSSLSASEAERSTNLLKFWYEMTRGRTVDAGKIHGFLECLGFTVKACKPHGDHFVTASVKPLQSKELCPVSAFGSDANGRYEIVLNWRSPPEAPIVQSVSDNRSRCVIVFHFGRLSNEAREWLRGWSIRNRTPFITVDESLVLYLSSLQSGTLRAFFDCTLPFHSRPAVLYSSRLGTARVLLRPRERATRGHGPLGKLFCVWRSSTR